MDTPGSAAILLVDDDELVRVATIGMLRSLGYVNITAAVDGEEADPDALKQGWTIPCPSRPIQVSLR